MTRTARRAPGKALVLRLYVADRSPNSVIAATNLREALASLPETEVSLEVINVITDPERALRDGVLVTPTLVKASPLPECRVIGNLRDRHALMAGLGLGEVDDA